MSSTGKTRFVCRVVRLQIALSGDAEKTTGHATNCPACQTYYRANNTLVSGLRREAAREVQPTPEDLAARIAFAVRQSTPRLRRSRLPAALIAFNGATAAVALSIFVVRQNPPIQPASPKNQTAAEISPGDVADLLANVDKLRIQFLDSVEPTATKLAAQNPLAQEITSVKADARSAANFLAMNFLPSDTAQRF